jgi:glutamyl-tRNA reductase
LQLVLLGVNYKTASLEQREKLAFKSVALAEALQTLGNAPGLQEVVVLSTCNRTELYAIANEPMAARATLMGFLAENSELPFSDLEPATYTYYNNFAARHLFEVTAGIDSMVLGENEILKQVKDAWIAAREAGTSYAVLNGLFKFAIHSGKRVRTETAINQGASSMSSVALELVRRHIPDLTSAAILLVGTGQIGQSTLKNLVDAGAQSLTIVNRTLEKAQLLADSLTVPAQVLPAEQLENAVQTADVSIFCTAADRYLLDATHADLLNQQRSQPVVLVDLAVPRNISPEVAALPNVHLYDVDSIQAAVAHTQKQRQASLAHVESILADEMARYLEWFNAREVVPTIESLYKLFDEIRQREIERGMRKYSGEADSETLDLLDRVTRAITQKILHYPVVQLKVEPDASQRQVLSDTLSTLFRLEQDPSERYVHHPVHSSVPAHGH